MNNLDLKPVKGIEDYARKQFTLNHFIYYSRKGSYALCHCAECGEKYAVRAIAPEDPFTAAALEEIEKPERDKGTVCRRCKTKAVFKPAGKTRSEYHSLHICLGQSIDDEHFVFRIFYATQQTRQDRETYYSCFEEKRIFLEKGKKPTRFDYYGDTWHKSRVGEYWFYTVHPKTYKEIKKCKMLKYVPVEPSIMEHYRDECAVIDYYIAAARYPDFEMILKMGLTEYARNLVLNIPVNPNPRGKTIPDRLRINKNRVKDLIAHQGERKTLELYQLEKRVKAHWTNEEIQTIEHLKEHTWATDWQKMAAVLKYTSPTRLRNYMKKQKMWYEDKLTWQEISRRQDLRREYYDYIRMREAQGYDMTNDIILFPADFVRRRDEMILQIEQAKMDKRKKEVLEKYPKIADKYKRLSEKYSAAAGGYIIRPAKNAAEIVEEGRILHHCVGGNDYLSSHNGGRSFILFLRSIDKKDIPFITVEIRGEEILQWYGAYDKKPEEKLINAWLKTYTKELKQRKKKGADNGTDNEQLSAVQASA